MTEAVAIRDAVALIPDRLLGVARMLAAMIATELGVAGCALVGPAPMDPPKNHVTVAPGIVFTLPPPAALGRPVEATQLITARYENSTFVFETRIRVIPGLLLVVGTDTLGRRAMTIDWAGGDLKVKAAPWVPSMLRAENVVADIMLMHWPENAVRAGLGPGVSLRDARPGQRVIAVGGRDMIRVERVAGTPDSWNGRWTYRNSGWGYELDIQSVEATP